MSGLGLSVMDEGVRSIELAPNLIFGVVPYRSFNPYQSHSKMGPLVAPTKKVSTVTLREQFSPDQIPNV